MERFGYTLRELLEEDVELLRLLRIEQLGRPKDEEVTPHGE